MPRHGRAEVRKPRKDTSADPTTTARARVGCYHLPVPEPLDFAVTSLLVQRAATLDVDTPDWMALGRAVHRRWLAGGGRGPLLALDAAHVRDADDVRAAARALGDGLLHLGPGVPVPPRLGVAVLQHAGASVGRPTLRDPAHAVATDPSLARARAAVLAHASAGEVVYLRGPDGSGRASLARWAAAELGAPALVEIAPDRPAHAPPGAWILIRDLEELSAERLGPLRARLAPAATSAWGAGLRGMRPDHPGMARLIGRDRAFCEVLAMALRHAPTTSPVLVLGESGTGKEPVARFVHEASERRGPLVAVDLASRNDNLLEDDLFGHVPGAFEGARTPREGAFRRAHRGTLFLDELGNMPLGAQLRLLRVLETGHVQPLGSDSTHPVDVRVVAATNADLEGMVHAGTFRRDLYHRLAGVVLRLPPLRERGEDVVLLAEAFAADAGAERLSADALECLRAQPWVGNVRELRRAIEVAAREARGGPIQTHHLRIARPMPILVTGRGDVLEHPGVLTRREAQALVALTVVVPAPAERGVGCIRSAVFGGLGGRPITPDALGRLVAWPWWGNFTELDRKLGALRSAPPGPIDTEALAALFPEVGGQSREPIVTLLSASVRDDGTVHGWRSCHHDGAVVIGRARARVDLDEPRRRWLASQADSPGFLPFPHLPELSRLHALITRQGDNLFVSSAPGVALPLIAGPLDGLVAQVEAGEGRSLGPAGEVRVIRAGEPVLQLFLFAGEAALAEATPSLRARLAGNVLETRFTGRSSRAWALSPDETDELNAIVLDFVRSDGDFAPHLRAALGSSPLVELRAYLLSSHPTQSCVRLYQSPLNQPLRADLAARIADAALVERARERLPTNLRTVVLEGGNEDR